MWFWWFMFFSNIWIPLIFVFGGRMMQKHCPKSINSVIGYRTKRSMINMDTWQFAHAFCGRILWKLGWILLIVSILIQIPFYRSSSDTVGILGGILCTVQCILLIFSILSTERALKQTFYEDGTRKSPRHDYKE